MTASIQATRPNEPNALGVLPAYHRLVSITRLPGPHGRGVTNLATLYHEHGEREVTWYSTQVDSRLKRGCYVAMSGLERPVSAGEVCRIRRLDLLDKPLPMVNPFKTVPASWVGDRSWVVRANALWQQVSRPFQHLLTAVFWDGHRLERFLTGPAALSSYRPLPNANLRHAVQVAEQALSLSLGLTGVSPSVLIAAALLHDAGKADDYRLNPERGGYAYSERGQLVGYRHTVLEWLAVARGRDGVIVPESQYLALIHALTATRGATSLGIREPQTIEAAILAVADQVCREDARALGYPATAYPATAYPARPSHVSRTR